MSEPPGRILVVDDNILNQKVLRRAIEEHGHHVQVAQNGRQALEMLESDSFDVVLLDILMPEMDGYQVLDNLKSDSKLRHIPVIMISAVDEMDSVIRCIEMGATDYLHKPFKAALLRARLNTSLMEKRLHDMEQAYLAQLKVEQEKSEQLLLNILPESIASRLKESGETIAESFSDVTVLFTDLVGFTSLSSKISPGELVSMLDRVFSTFDDIADMYGLEKIKTIGDAYMAVSGLPLAREDHLEAAADMALDLLAAIQDLNDQMDLQLGVRIGLHVGPVVAGVIGRKKFIYDLWGNTVNIASRMESHGVVNQIHVSDEIYQRLDGRYDFDPVGSIEVKGVGEMETYLLVGPSS